MFHAAFLLQAPIIEKDKRGRRVATRALAKRVKNRKVVAMSTVQEIETAIEKLSPQQQRELAAWYEERQALLNASDALLQVYDREEEAK
ncbi:MAG TPA: hypothetical protein VNW30_10600 [Opitutaceae bacterium]|jgi:hypothetical protein|nr:hypothetical protein [Opitutaceae bacterium]